MKLQWALCYNARTMSGRALGDFRDTHAPAVVPPRPLLSRSAQQLRETLDAVVRATTDGALPADGGFARAGLRRRIASYAADRRASGLMPEELLIELKDIVGVPSRGLDPADRRRVLEQIIGWAIEAYYGTTVAPADLPASGANASAR